MRFVDFSNELAERTGKPGEGWILVAETDSTQRLARRILEEYLGEGQRLPEITLLAWQQHAGLGRQCRSWSSPPGAGIYATLVRHLPDPSFLQLLPVVAAVSMGTWLRRRLGGRGGLKWPNDLVVDGRKIGGILLEAVTRREQSVVLIGIGLNYSRDVTVFGQPEATSLQREWPESQLPSSLGDVALEAIAAVDEGLARFQDLEDLVARYRRLTVHRRGDRLRCRLDSETLEGFFLGFSQRGFLRLEVAGEERIIRAGEVVRGV